MPEPITPIKHLVLQGDADAGGFTILNLNLSGLNLTKASVGLGNVDNTADAVKPISAAMTFALAGKEPLVAAGTTGQFWRGDKTWQTYGALALQDGNTTLPSLSALGSGALFTSTVAARRSDFGSSSIQAALQQNGALYVTSILGLPGGNTGVLSFEGASFGIIKTNNSAPLVFGVNGSRRMRLTTGLNVGGDTDPGAGCISAFGTVTAGHFSGAGDLLTGLTKEQIPTILRSTAFPSITINGVNGAGYLGLAAQTINPPTALAAIFATAAGRFAIWHSGSTAHAIEFNNAGMTANRLFAWPDLSGTVAVGTKDTAWAAWTGSGSKLTKAVGSATLGDCAAAIKSIIDALIGYNIIGA